MEKKIIILRKYNEMCWERVNYNFKNTIQQNDPKILFLRDFIHLNACNIQWL